MSILCEETTPVSSNRCRFNVYNQSYSLLISCASWEDVAPRIDRGYKTWTEEVTEEVLMFIKADSDNMTSHVVNQNIISRDMASAD